MLGLGMVLAVLAAIVHVVIFYMESIDWEGPLARRTFGGSPTQARPHTFYAYNQGFYNLFLAVQTFCGVIALSTGFTATGGALTLAGTGSMLAAAAVLYLAAPEYRTAAVKQGIFPLAAVVLVSLGLMF